MLRCPIFHVNGEDPGGGRAGREARDGLPPALRRDVVIDMYCYRRYGHNEGDEPRFTQPVMYAAIDKKPTVREVYVKRLVELGNITEEQAEEIEHARQARARSRRSRRRAASTSCRRATRCRACGPATRRPRRRLSPRSTPRCRSSACSDLLDTQHATCRPTSTCTPSSSACSRCGARWPSGKRPLDWGTGEMLAFASLVDRALRACACPARTRGAARSATATRCCTTT